MAKSRKPPPRRGTELFQELEDGTLSDAAIHEAILDNPRAEAAIAADAVRRAIARGMAPDLAAAIYGPG